MFDPNTDPTYIGQVGDINQGLQDTTGTLLQQLTSGLTSYGYKATFDPNDPFKVTSLAYDPNNPFSKASLLRQSYQRNQARDTNSYAARGQLYSGALNNERDFTTGNFNQGNDAILRAVQALIQNVGERRNTAVDTAASQTGTAGSDALTRFINVHANDPASVAPGSPPPGATPGTTPAPAAARPRQYSFATPALRGLNRRLRR